MTDDRIEHLKVQMSEAAAAIESAMALYLPADAKKQFANDATEALRTAFVARTKATWRAPTSRRRAPRRFMSWPQSRSESTRMFSGWPPASSLK